MNGGNPTNITIEISPPMWITLTLLPTPELPFRIFVQALEVNDPSASQLNLIDFSEPVC
jgi:hypothetical protein